MRRTYILAALLATAALSSAPTPAQAKVAWQDCRANGGSSLQGHYTIAQLNKALRTMPAYVQEYSNCASVIEAQIQKQELAAHRHGREPGTTATTTRPQGSNAGSGPEAHAAADSASGGSTILIVVIAVVAVAGMILAFWASRRRGGGEPPSDGPSAT